MSHRTAQELLSITDPALFERLVLDVLACIGYRGVHPGSLSLADGGRDAESFYCEATHAWVVFTLQRQWKARYRRDMDRALDTRRPVERFIFCTNRAISPAERAALERGGAQYQIEVHVFDGERLCEALDTVCTDVRQTYLGLPDPATLRRLVRFTLIDPEHEVETLEPWRVEHLFPACRVARGLFALLRSQNLSEVSISGEEAHALSAVLESYVPYRRAAAALEALALERAGEARDRETRAGDWLRSALAGGPEAADPAVALRLREVRETAAACAAAVEAVRVLDSLSRAPRLAPGFPTSDGSVKAPAGFFPTTDGQPAPSA